MHFSVSFFHPHAFVFLSTVQFTSSSSYYGLRAALHAPPPSTIGCISWNPCPAASPHHAQERDRWQVLRLEPADECEGESGSVPAGFFSQTPYLPSSPSSTGHAEGSPLRSDALSRAAARTLLHFIALARSAVPIGAPALVHARCHLSITPLCQYRT
jgi:hypothetical protein